MSRPSTLLRRPLASLSRIGLACGALIAPLSLLVFAAHANGVVYHSSDLGWEANKNITSAFSELLDNGKFAPGVTLVLEDMFDMDAGVALQLPRGFVLEGRDGGGINIRTSEPTSRPILRMGDGGGIVGVTFRASDAPVGEPFWRVAEAYVDYHPAKAIAIHEVDDVEIIDSDFSGNIGQFINVFGSRNLVIERTRFKGARTQLLLSGNVLDARIADSRFEEAVGDGIKTIDGNIIGTRVLRSLFARNHRDGIDTTGGFKNALIEDSIFFENSTALDIKSQVHDEQDLTRKNVNSGIRVRNGYIVRSSNAIVVSFRDYADLVDEQNARDYIPSDIQIEGTVFAEVGTAFLVKDGYDVRWKDVVFQRVHRPYRLLNKNAPRDWLAAQAGQIAGNHITADPRTYRIEDLWP